jgi:hypothetical protein
MEIVIEIKDFPCSLTFDIAQGKWTLMSLIQYVYKFCQTNWLELIQTKDVSALSILFERLDWSILDINYRDQAWLQRFKHDCIHMFIEHELPHEFNIKSQSCQGQLLIRRRLDAS